MEKNAFLVFSIEFFFTNVYKKLWLEIFVFNLLYFFFENSHNIYILSIHLQPEKITNFSFGK